MRVWLDDERPMPDGYDVHVKNSHYMYAIIDTGFVTNISFDHDMGIDNPTGHDIAKYLEEKYHNCELARWINYTVHTGNPVGRQNICAALQRAYQYWRGDSE